MKNLGDLKNQVENAKSKEEAKSLIEKAGMSPTADELEIVTGGGSVQSGAAIGSYLLDPIQTRFDGLEFKEWDYHRFKNLREN